MAYLTFDIPDSLQELMEFRDGYYHVDETIPAKQLLQKLTEAKQSLREEGAEFIFDTFPTFFSVLHGNKNVSAETEITSFNLLQKAMDSLLNNISMLLDGQNTLLEEIKMKYCNLMKMLVYIYVKTVAHMEQANEVERSETNNRAPKTKKKAANTEIFSYDKSTVFTTLCDLSERDISVFWDPPIVESKFTVLLSDVCYQFLEYPMIKPLKDVRTELFCVLGALIKNFDHGNHFVTRIGQLIKEHEHLINCLPEGIQILVEKYNCKGLIHSFVVEMTEWQTQLNHPDNQGTRYCSLVLLESAVLMPKLMMPEVIYLDSYLANDPYVLRNSILTIITEVILKVLTKHDLTEEERRYRDDFFKILEEHMNDVTAQVRARVFQLWARLQSENAIPLAKICGILRQIIEHVWDKGALARKAAASCVADFLKCNPYGPKLSRKDVEEALKEASRAYETKQKAVGDVYNEKSRKLNKKYIEKEDKIKMALSEVMEQEKEIPKLQNLDEKEASRLIFTHIESNEFQEAAILCLQIAEQHGDKFDELKKDLGIESDLESLNILLRMYYVKHAETQTPDFEMMAPLEERVARLKDQIEFVELMEEAVERMLDLIRSAVLTDLQEATDFFVAAYQFDLHNAIRGIYRLLRVLQKNEPERRDLVVKALRTVYLATDEKDLVHHTTIICSRLLDLVRTVPPENYSGLKFLIKTWVARGDFDNSIIDRLWKVVTSKTSSDTEVTLALKLIGIAATGRETIVKRNIKLIATIGFGERGSKCMELVAAACDCLEPLGRVVGEEKPFRIPCEDSMWNELVGLLEVNFFKSVEWYNNALTAGIKLIYSLCSKPDEICNPFVENISNGIQKERVNGKEIDSFVLIRFCLMLGELGLRHYYYLDETVYKEMKRRVQEKEEEKAQKKKKNKKNVRKSITATEAGKLMNSSVAEDSMLEGAQAEDQEAEYVLDLLENHIVTGNGGLAQFAPLLIALCTKSIYQRFDLQNAAVKALCRFMMVSSSFCEKNIQLIFTLLEKTPFPKIKCLLLIHISDLLVRFPNVVEPWTPKIYDRLKDKSYEVRISAFQVLSRLILQDMILAHGHLSEMALCITDPEEKIQEMARHFFTEMSKKSNSLYCALPDIMSHLCELQETEEVKLREIMKFLFSLVDKTKQMEGLVDRFCSKYTQTTSNKTNRNITFCLTLIQYSEKAICRLLENYPLYKELLHDSEIYAMFKQITANCLKVKGAKVAVELEEKIAETFNTSESSADDKTFKKPERPQRRKLLVKGKKDANTSATPKKVVSKKKQRAVESPGDTPSRSMRTRRQQKYDDSDSDSVTE